MGISYGIRAVMKALAVWVILGLHAGAAAAQEPEGIVAMDAGLQDLYEQEQRMLASKTAQDAQDYGLIENLFFENEIVKIYNYTAYEADGAKNKFLSGQSEQIGLQDFAVSFGYGMEFRVNPRHSIGYEYLSNFPYDRGQIIRLFWNYVF